MQRSILDFMLLDPRILIQRIFVMKLYFRLLVIALFLQISPQNGARKVLFVVEKQSNRGKEHIDIRLRSSILVNLKYKTHTLYSLHNAKVLIKNSKIVIFKFTLV